MNGDGDQPMGTATHAWPDHEVDPDRAAILTAADRLLAGAPRASTGRLSVVQLAVEAGVKYWVVAQKHTDLRDHFQYLVAQARINQAAVRQTDDNENNEERDRLRIHCAGLEELLRTYATVINELDLENQALREQFARQPGSAITPIRRRQPP